MPPRTGLKLACFDGGGSKSYSQLVIMKELMDQLRKRRYPNEYDNVIRPCDHFNLIGGCDTGGILAIMFARLQLSVDEVMAEWSTIVDRVYKPHFRNPEHRMQTLKICLEEMFHKRQLPLETNLQDGWQASHCAGFVLVTSPIEMGHKLPLRTYDLPNELPSGITVIDAMLHASSSYFEPETRVGSVEEVSSTARFEGNPVRRLIIEARALHGGDSTVACLLSLGSGHSGVTHMFRLRERSILNNSYQETMADSDLMARETQRQMQNFDTYFRLSVVHGMTKEPNCGDEAEWYRVQAMSYLQDADTIETVSNCVQSLCEDGERRCTSLDTLEQNFRVVAEDTPVHAQYFRCDASPSQDIGAGAMNDLSWTVLLAVAGFVISFGILQSR